MFGGGDHLMALVRQLVKWWFDKLTMMTRNTNVMMSKIEPGRFPSMSLPNGAAVG
jgi:hypothetical protein